MELQTLYSLNVQETIFHVQQKGNYITNDQRHTCDTRTSSTYHQYVHMLRFNFITLNHLL